MDLFFILIVSLLAIVVTFVCTLLFFGGMKIIDVFKGFKAELQVLNQNMTGIVTVNNEDHNNIKKKLLDHDSRFITVNNRIDYHLIQEHEKIIKK